MYLMIVFSCTAAMDKSASILCWTAFVIILHGEISSQPIYENYKEDRLITNRTDSYYKEVYDRETFLENHANTLEKELDICRDASAETFTSQSPASGKDLSLGSRGKGFLVLFMKHHESSTKNVYVTSEKGVQINITTSSRLNPSLKMQIDMNLNIPSSHHFIFPNGIELEYFQKEFKSVLIETSDDVFVVSLDDAEHTADGTTNIPIHKLSTRYVVITIQPSSLKSQLAVAALENYTVISVRFRMKLNTSLNIEGSRYYNGDVFNFSLDRLETYQIAHDTDLTGTFIESSNPIAAFSGNDCIKLYGLGYCDLLMEQLPPIDVIDKTYIVPPNSNGRDTIIRITATEMSDIYYVIGTANRTRLLKKYDIFDIRISSNQSCYIKSTKPVLVTGFGLSSNSSNLGDPAMTIVPGINQYLNYYKIPIPTGYVHNVVSFMIKESSKAFIRINDAIPNAVDIVFEDSLSDGHITYSVVSVQVTQGELKAFTLDGERFGVMVSGVKNNEAYGFSGNSLLP